MKSMIVGVLAIGAVGVVGYRLSIGLCDRPMEYSIGVFDNKFGLSQAAFQKNILQAEKVWETASGKDLFVYKPEAKFTVNLIYDERQREVDLKQKTEFGLSAAERDFRHKDAVFNNTRSEYERRAAAHENIVEQFENDSRAYEERVGYWNERGGAPAKGYAKLEAERRELNSAVIAINKSASEINVFLNQVNIALGDRKIAGENYNALARDYNAKYGAGLEFDQAEYTGQSINIYEFKNENDLTIALAHELGHALGIGHVENAKSIMYYLTGEQTVNLTEEDLVELKKVCK